MKHCNFCLHTGYLTTRDGREAECPACAPPAAHPTPEEARGAMEAAVRTVTMTREEVRAHVKRTTLDPRTPYCIDCGSPDTKDVWGGGSRCQKCSDKFREQVQAERQRKFKAELARKKAHIDYRHQHDECPDDGEVCEDCCCHDDVDDGFCANCEADLSESLAAAAEDRAEAAREYWAEYAFERNR